MAVGLYVGYDPRTGNWDLVWNKAGDAVHLYARAIDGMAFTSVDPHNSPLRAGLPDQLLDLDQATGRFEDITHAAGLIGRSPTRAVVAGDSTTTWTWICICRWRRRFGTFQTSC